jgi:hypothetical protein
MMLSSLWRSVCVHGPCSLLICEVYTISVLQSPAS